METEGYIWLFSYYITANMCPQRSFLGDVKSVFVILILLCFKYFLLQAITHFCSKPCYPVSVVCSIQADFSWYNIMSKK